eukprot:COSAG06_NODE_45229_length_356_cov_1.194553_1_plen_22_part_10
MEDRQAFAPELRSRERQDMARR